MNVMYKIFRAVEYLKARIYDHSDHFPSSVKPSLFSYDTKIDWLIEQCNKPGYRVLEIGAKEVTSRSLLKTRLSSAQYIGTDIQPGRNVDIVCDAHELSKYIDSNSIDVVYSSVTFQAFSRPWVVAEEIAKILKIGGLVCIETHFSFKCTQRPWNFFHFSDHGLGVIFNKRLGFHCVDRGLDCPLKARFSLAGPVTLGFSEIGDMFSHSYFVGIKTVDTVPGFDWRDVGLSDVHIDDGSRYPLFNDNDRNVG